MAVFLLLGFIVGLCFGSFKTALGCFIRLMMWGVVALFILSAIAHL
ncbi:MAG: hypothetical protein WCI47_02570 [bacterium]